MAMISVVMPAFNAEKYARMAIESVINQTYDDWELIIVDDCSKDQTGYICDEYSLKDDRITIYHLPENVGISRAKNEGLYRATGKYIAFCDDDDVMYENALLDNVALIQKYDADIVRWSYKTKKVDEKGQIYQIKECKCDNGVYLSREDIFSHYSNVHSMLSCDWTGLYRKSLLEENKVIFNPEFRYGGEDTFFNIELLKYVEKMVMNEKCYYDWHLRKNHSTTAKHDINFCHSMLKVANLEKEIIKKNCNDYEKLWEEYGEFYRQLICNYAKELKKDDYNRVLCEIEGIR